MHLWGKRSTRNNEKKQSKIIVITSLIGLSMNFLTQSLFPLIGIPTIHDLGHLYTLIMLGGVYYAIKNYQFMQIPSSMITKELFQEIMDITFLIDSNGLISRSNKTAKALLGFQDDELNGLPITSVITEELFCNSFYHSQNNMKSTKLFHINVNTTNGSTIPFDITIQPLRDTKRNLLLGTLIIGQDIRLIESLKNEVMNHFNTSQKLQKSEELFRTMIEMMPFSVTLTSIADDTIIYVNSKAQELFQITLSEVVGSSILPFYENKSDRSDIIRELKEGKPVREREVNFRRSDGSIITGSLTLTNIYYNEQHVLLSCMSDITEQRKLQQNIAQSEELLHKLMNSIPDMVTVTDLEGNITFYNQSISMLGYTSVDEVLPMNFLSVFHEDDVYIAKTNFSKMFTSELGPVEYTLTKKDGTFIEVEVNGSILRDKKDVPYGIIFVSRDSTERKKAQEEFRKSKEEIEKINKELLKTNTLLQERSIRDSLTNLYNHQHINELLDLEIAAAIKQNTDLCLMMLDIDFFKHVNDNYGHQTGDKVLVTLTDLIKTNVRGIDLVGRYGGEEFIIILPNLSIKEAHQIAEKIRLCIQRYDFKLDHHTVTISIGLTKYKSENAKSFINRADTLLYRAKRNGRNRVEM
jgi:diguanylate cyclase (GGDEF)-like protein/PAS domain S-box-containing protein